MKDLLDALMVRPRVGVRNWPKYLQPMRDGYVRASAAPQGEHFRLYEITDRGRRKASAYRGVFA